MPPGSIDNPRRNVARSAVLVGLLTLLTWPVRTLVPSTDIDVAWMGGLHLAAIHQLRAGHDVLFTHGPLGFLVGAQLWSRPTAIFAVAFAVAAQAGLIGALLVLTSRLMRLPLAVGLTYLFTRLVVRPPSELLALVMLLCCLDLVQAEHRPRHLAWWAALGGLVAGVELLTKFNDGIYSLALFTVTVAALVDRRRVLWTAAAALAPLLTAAIAWAAIGQHLADLPGWVAGSLQFARGYGAMATEEAGRRGEYLEALLYAGGVVALLTGAGRGRRRLATALLLLGAAYVEFEHGFIRHNRHVLGFFLVLAVLPFALRVSAKARAAQYGLAAFGLVGLVVATQSALPVYLRDSLTSVPRAAAQLADLASPSGAARLEQRSQRALRQAYALDGGTRAAIGRHTVQIDPYDTAVAWAYGLTWDPVPVFQLYAAYTPALDRADADALTGSGAPERILRARHGSIDNRYPAFEAPRYVLAELCNYRQERLTTSWQLLRHTDPRCGPVRVTATVEVQPGQTVRVPEPSRPDAIVVASLHLPQRLLDTLIGTVFRPPRASMIELDGVSWRLVPANVQGPLIMRSPSYAAPGPGAGGRIDIDAFRLVHLSGAATVEFAEVPLVR